MRDIKIDFIDFWPNLDKTNNYFYNILSEFYNVIIDSEKPDLIFYSCYGYDYLKYKCKRIFFTGENRRPDFMACDFAFSFDFNNRKDHYRLPLYLLYLDEANMNNKITEIKSRRELSEAWNNKKKLCCMVVSNPNAKERINFFHNLSSYIDVDSGGKVLNNVGGPVADKIKFIQDYKFVISFENESHDGYTTEKILEPIFVDSIPIYWGNRLVNKDFNPKRFLNYQDFETEEELIARLLEIDKNSEIAIDILSQEVFSQEVDSPSKIRKNVLEIIIKVIENNKKPKSQSYHELIHRIHFGFNRKLKMAKKKISYLFKSS
ncbi:hypothetical protein B6A10_15430 [Flavobacterium sp. L1I52]|uniref:Glycosyltransferase family 10 (Fucosyltransferase) C-term n=1 Tax=Flavobacterium pokkalii TaxID=1940408 RepID=A0ABR7UV13_9FLAO|nr:glycosyltransferase family 10 [Flavobacterium pokkalii]MBD0726564.1 hypothetical protein [Flavobacterium pokkalii]